MKNVTQAGVVSVNGERLRGELDRGRLRRLLQHRRRQSGGGLRYESGRLRRRRRRHGDSRGGLWVRGWRCFSRRHGRTPESSRKGLCIEPLDERRDRAGNGQKQKRQSAGKHHSLSEAGLSEVRRSEVLEEKHGPYLTYPGGHKLVRPLYTRLSVAGERLPKPVKTAGVVLSEWYRCSES
jgi:hypothetical protein